MYSYGNSGRQRVKITCLLRQLLFGQAPTSLSDDIHLVSEGRLHLIRLAADNCSVPCTPNTFGDRRFTAVRIRFTFTSPRVEQSDTFVTSIGPQLYDQFKPQQC